MEVRFTTTLMSLEMCYRHTYLFLNDKQERGIQLHEVSVQLQAEQQPPTKKLLDHEEFAFGLYLKKGTKSTDSPKSGEEQQQQDPSGQKPEELT